MSNSSLRLNLQDGSVSFQFTPVAAQQLKTQLTTLVQQLKKAATITGTTGDRPTQQASLEYQYTGDIFLELFCNPNIWSSPFAAKVLVTVRDERIRLTTEVELPRIVEDINAYLEQNSSGNI
ncbi:MAG: hypothetical protein VKJ64_04385 [Leptolyngbyaceae bacterium]|nr:hypothetical protein [Leptolyngbyaceae bacterium]